MPKIKDEKYTIFKAGKRFDYLTEDDLNGWLERIDYPKGTAEARAFLILLYYTGRRPSEILNMRGLDSKRNKVKRVFGYALKPRKEAE